MHDCRSMEVVNLKKRKSTADELEQERRNILREREYWKSVCENGCSDPFWPDGCNMNLIRNHIIYARNRILELCQQGGITLPEEYYLEVPPEVPDSYMADGGAIRPNVLLLHGGFSRRKPEWDDNTLRFL